MTEADPGPITEAELEAEKAAIAPDLCVCGQPRSEHVGPAPVACVATGCANFTKAP